MSDIEDTSALDTVLKSALALPASVISRDEFIYRFVVVVFRLPTMHDNLKLKKFVLRRLLYFMKLQAYSAYKACNPSSLEDDLIETTFARMWAEHVKENTIIEAVTKINVDLAIHQ